MNESRIIRAGNFIDGSGREVQRDVYIEVKQGVITGVKSAAELPDTDLAEFDDFSHCTILPALVDCSVYLSRSPAINGSAAGSTSEETKERKGSLLKKHISYCHAYGVQGVVECDSIHELLHFSETKEQNKHIEIKEPCKLVRRENEYVHEATAAGDYIRVSYSSGIEGTMKWDNFSVYDDLVRIIKKSGEKKVVVVANGQRMVSEALRAGCDAIEQGYDMGEANLVRMAELKVMWIPNLMLAKNGVDSSGSGGDVCCRFSQRYVAPGKSVPGAESFWKNKLSEQLKQVRFARQAGVCTAVGTGAGSTGVLHGESVAEEMKLFIKAGYSLEESFRCASENGAKFFAMNNLGALIPGKRATFLISRGSVRQLPRKLSYLEGIYIDGMPASTYSKIPG